MRAAFVVLLLACARRAKPETSFSAMESAIRSGEFKKIGSVVVSRGGKIVYEKYFDGDANTLRNTRSATKTVTGMLVGLAIDKKLISGIDAPIGQFFDHLDPLKSKITVEDLLTMNSALDCNDSDDKSPGNEEGMYPQQDWVKFALDLPVRQTRGYSYCTAGVVALGAVLEKAAGMPLPDFARKNLFDPLGIGQAKWKLFAQRSTDDGRRPGNGHARPGEARTIVCESRKVVAIAAMGGGIGSSASAHRRSHRVRLPVVDWHVRVAAGLFHDGERREQSGGIS